MTVFPPYLAGAQAKEIARIEIVIVRRAEARAYTAVTLRPAGGEVKRIPAALYFMKNPEIAVTQAQVQRESRPPLELVLDITKKLRLAQAVYGIFARDTGPIGLVGRKAGERAVSDRAEGTAPLVHLYAADLDSGLDYISSLDRGYIAKPGKRIAHAGADTAVV